MNGYHANGLCNGGAQSNGIDYLKDDDDFASLEADKNELLTNFQSLANDYVESLIDYKVNKLDKFKQEVLKIESTDNGLSLIDLVSNLNGENLNDKIKNFINYKRKLEERLCKLKSQMKGEKERTEQLSEQLPIDLSNLNKLNLENLKLNKLDDDEEKNLSMRLYRFLLNIGGTY